MNYSDVQKIAKDTIEFAKKNIHSGMSLIEVRELCEHKLIELGADSFWYWNIGAFVFAGDETAISVSGKKYSTSDRIIAEEDIITIDLSPQCNNIWGDYARTLVIQNAFIENVVTHVDYRGKGYATDSLNYAKMIAEKAGCYKMMLLTGSKEEKTFDFYENAGYNSTDKTAFIQWID